MKLVACIMLLLAGQTCAASKALRVGISAITNNDSLLNGHIKNDNIEPTVLALLEKQLRREQANAPALDPILSGENADKEDLLRQDKLDVIWTQSIDRKLPADVIMTDPIFTIRWSIISLHDQQPDKKEVWNALDLTRMVVTDDNIIPALLQHYPKMTLIRSHSLADAVSLLKAGAAKGLICQENIAQVLSKNIYPDQLDLDLMPNLVTHARLIMRATDAQQLTYLNRAITRLPQTELQIIISRNITVDTLIQSMDKLRSSYRHFDVIVTLIGVFTLFLISFLIAQIIRRRQAEHHLQDTAKFWQTLLHSLPTPVMLCNAESNIIDVNEALRQSFGVKDKQIIGQRVEDVNQRYFASAALETPALVAAITSSDPCFFNGNFTLEGQTHHVTGWITPYSNTEMVPQGLVIGWHDITERIALENQLADALQQANKFSEEKSVFLAHMSHEIRSPLNIIMGVLEMESQHISNPQSPLAVAYHASRGLLRIIGDILDLSKIEAGEVRLNVRPVSLHALLEKAAESYELLAVKKGLRLDSDIGSCYGCHYLLDEGKTEQLLNNLLSNAVKYTLQGFVALSASVTPIDSFTHQITLSVSDSGIGIASSQLPDMLLPYHQVSNRSADSTGLGLAICRQLVSLMGGKMSISSEPHQGSVFSVSLTLALVETNKTTLPLTACIREEKARHIWVIDDMPANLMVMKMQLSALGHEVSTFEQSEQALAAWSQQPRPAIDVIFTDCQMPSMTGYEFTKALRALEAGQPTHQLVIGCTANAFNDEALNCLRSGMDAHLTKPITQSDLARCLVQYLDQRCLDFSEVLALSAGKENVFKTLLNELKKSSVEDITLIAQAASDNDTNTLKSKIHRLKGNFSLTRFEAGLSQCRRLERKLAVGEDIALLLLQLKQTTSHFISLLQNFYPLESQKSD